MRKALITEITQESDERLMVLIAAGNRLAFETLYDRYFDKLRWFSQGFLKEEAAAEDVVQELFMKIMRPGHGYSKSQSFSTWAYSLAANRCKNILRDESNRQRILQENHNEEYSDTLQFIRSLDSQILAIHIQRLMSNKTEKEQDLYRLRFEQDMSVKEISAILNMPEGSVKSGLYYLLKKLSEPIKQLVDESR